MSLKFILEQIMGLEINIVYFNKNIRLFNLILKM